MCTYEIPLIFVCVFLSLIRVLARIWLVNERMDSYHHKSGSKKRKEKIVREKSAKRGQRSLSRFLIPGGECSTCVDNAVMISLESDAADVGDTYTSRFDCELTLEQSCSDSSSCSSAALEVQPSRTVSPRSSGSIAPTAESTVVECTPLLSVGQLHSFDIGMLNNETPSSEQIRTAVQRGHQRHPTVFPPDKTGRNFPCSLLNTQLSNGEKVLRDWLVWSNEKQSLYCFC